MIRPTDVTSCVLGIPTGFDFFSRPHMGKLGERFATIEPVPKTFNGVLVWIGNPKTIDKTNNNEQK